MSIPDSRNELEKRIAYLEQELVKEKKSTADLKDLFFQAKMPFFIINCEGRFLQANDTAVDFLNCSRRTLLTKRVWDFSPPGTATRQGPEDFPFFARQTLEREFLVNDCVKSLLLHVVPVERAREKKLYCLGIDITNQKQIQKQLVRANKNEALCTLTAGMAHEFNNALSIIIGNVELALDDFPENHPAGLCMQAVFNAAGRVKRVIRQLLDFSFNDGGKQELVELGAIIRDSMEFIRPILPPEIEIETEVPEFGFTICGNRAQIHQMMMNITKNALQAMADRAGTIRLEVGRKHLAGDTGVSDFSLAGGDYARIRLIDQGVGIDGRELDRIFDPFYTTRPVGGGLGLGLSVVHGIIKAHRGAISVESRPNKGCGVEILLPLVKRSTWNQATQDSYRLLKGAERILLVDDEMPILRLYRQMLERFGYRVEATNDPHQALSLAKGDPGRYDLVITDFNMPGMYGDLLVQEIKKFAPLVKIIFCVSRYDHFLEKKLTDLGCNATVYKPASTYKLATVVRSVLNNDAPGPTPQPV